MCFYRVTMTTLSNTGTECIAPVEFYLCDHETALTSMPLVPCHMHLCNISVWVGTRTSVNLTSFRDIFSCADDILTIRGSIAFRSRLCLEP